jgi:N-acylglucosamine-6-phosphate 2-epimerase
LGADIVATTLSGYTPYSRQQTEPDFELIRELAQAVDVPIIAEGRIATPAQARQALECGAFAVVVGSMITRPAHITAYFVRGISGER